MSELGNYVRDNTHRGSCNCGRCVDRGTAPDPAGTWDDDPNLQGHTIDMVFFKVAATGGEADEFRRLTAEHEHAFGGRVNPLDGREHSFVELGGWIGDQGLAIQYMALGCLLGVFGLLSPDTMLSAMNPSDEERMLIAQAGYLSIMTAS